MNTRNKLVLGNWKMQLGLVAAKSLAREIAAHPLRPGPRLGVFPSHPHLDSVAAQLPGREILLGAQDVDAALPGAVTGAVSAEQLRELDVTIVLLGHSERRSLFGETDAQIGAKLRACLRAELWPLLCLGEQLPQRREGRASEVVLAQLNAALAGLTPAQLTHLHLAYEPVWAIGSGLNANPEDVQAMHALLRAALRAGWGEAVAQSPILYGGSVRAENARSYFDLPDVDGALVGNASLKSDHFLAIAACCPGGI